MANMFTRKEKVEQLSRELERLRQRNRRSGIQKRDKWDFRTKKYIIQSKKPGGWAPQQERGDKEKDWNAGDKGNREMV